jgi:hypothetical protein
MGCCRRFIARKISGARPVICLKYVTPLSLLTVISIWVDVLYALLHLDDLSLTIKLVMLIHLVVSVFVLLECRRSVSYHRLYGSPD